MVVELVAVDTADAAVVGATAVAAAVSIGVEDAVAAGAVDSVAADEDAETNLAAYGVGAVLPTAVVFAYYLHEYGGVLQLAVLPNVYVALLAVVAVAMQPVVPHIVDVDLRLVEPVVPPFVAGVLLPPLDDDVPLLPAFGAHLRQRDDEPPLHVVSNVLLPQLSAELHLPPPVFVSFLPFWQLHLEVWHRHQDVEQQEVLLLVVVQSMYLVFALQQRRALILLFPYQLC